MKLTKKIKVIKFNNHFLKVDNLTSSDFFQKRLLNLVTQERKEIARINNKKIYKHKSNLSIF